MERNSCSSFKSYATSQAAWRLSDLDNGLRVFEEEESHKNNFGDGLPSGCKVRSALGRTTMKK